MKRYYYSADLLRKRGACNKWVNEFERTFGTGRVELTPEFCQALLDGCFPVCWPAQGLWYSVIGRGSPIEVESYRLYQKCFCCYDAHELYSLLVQTAELWARYHGGER